MTRLLINPHVKIWTRNRLIGRAVKLGYSLRSSNTFAYFSCNGPTNRASGKAGRMENSSWKAVMTRLHEKREKGMAYKETKKAMY